MDHTVAAGQTTPLALRGVRIVDFSWVLAGPMTTKLLAVMGAEVIKIETSLRPEYVRRGRFFPIINNTKRSCTINLTKAAGQDLIHRLIAVSDMIVENFSAGVLAKYGLGYEELKKIHPDLIFVSASGLGRTGPQRDALAYGTLLQAYSGRASMIGEINAELEGMGIHGWTDPITAIWESVAILAALYHRRRTGAGAYIDLSMMEGTVALLPEALLRQALGDSSPSAGANRDIGSAPGGCFRCAGDDQWITLSVRTDAQWQALCAVMGRADLAADRRFADSVLRQTNRAELDRVFAEWARHRSADEIERLLQGRAVPASRSRNILDILNDPQVTERGLFPTLPNGLRTAALPWRDSNGWRGDIRLAPELGADNDYVFRELLGMEQSEVDELTAAGVIC